VALWLLWSARASVLAQLDDPQQRAEWQEWKQQEESRAAAKDAPVTRRPPTSTEPPSLVLMRDHFAAAVASCLAAGTVLFVFVAFVVRGAVSSYGQAASIEPADDGQLFARHAENRSTSAPP
jgi:hypothetical protein